jgi:hypothetical protein
MQQSELHRPPVLIVALAAFDKACRFSSRLMPAENPLNACRISRAAFVARWRG